MPDHYFISKVCPVVVQQRFSRLGWPGAPAATDNSISFVQFHSFDYSLLRCTYYAFRSRFCSPDRHFNVATTNSSISTPPSNTPDTLLVSHPLLTSFTILYGWST